MKRILFVLFIGITGLGLGQTQGGGVLDIEGNNYTTVVIGAQEWMAENLKTRKYDNGQDINNGISDGFNEGGWVYYENSAQYDNPYGKLYNWYATVDSRNLCPAGWHMPTESDWQQLIDFLGGENIAGGKLKSTEYWASPNTGATNETGFAAVPGGQKEWSETSGSLFNDIGVYGIYWTSTEIDSLDAWYYYMRFDNSIAERDGFKKSEGYSVRCLKNDDVGLINLNSEERKIIKILDLMGRETTFKPNIPIIYVYDDGTSEKVFTIED